jgi:SAM-dependent methyltransferase
MSKRHTKSATARAICSDPEYAARLIRLQQTGWKRFLHVQAPYRWNLRRLQPGLTLEIGCGIGRNLLHLEGAGVGIDLNPHCVEAARGQGLSAFTPADFLNSAFNQLGTFDSLLLSHVAEHMARAEVVNLIRQYLPLLKPDGRLILFTPQEAGFRTDPTHVEFMDLEKLQAICLELTFEPERLSSFPFPRIFGKIFIYNEFVLVGRRLGRDVDPDALTPCASGTYAS